MKKNTLLLLVLWVINSATVQAQLNEKLIGDFYQTIVQVNKPMKKCLKDKSWGNCVVIALIKAAVSEFKTVGNIYRSFTITGDNINIVFNDGLDVEVTESELGQTRQLSFFGKETNSIYYDSAIIVYASICKRILKYKNIPDPSNKKCINNFEDAVHFINSGYATDAAAALLGLKFSKKNVEDIPSLESAIIRTRVHTAYCTGGIQDISGKKFLVHDGLMKNPASGPRPIKAVYVLTK